MATSIRDCGVVFDSTSNQAQDLYSPGRLPGTVLVDRWTGSVAFLAALIYMPTARSGTLSNRILQLEILRGDGTTIILFKKNLVSSADMYQADLRNAIVGTTTICLTKESTLVARTLLASGSTPASGVLSSGELIHIYGWATEASDD